MTSLPFAAARYDVIRQPHGGGADNDVTTVTANGRRRPTPWPWSVHQLGPAMKRRKAVVQHPNETLSPTGCKDHLVNIEDDCVATADDVVAAVNDQQQQHGFSFNPVSSGTANTDNFRSASAMLTARTSSRQHRWQSATVAGGSDPYPASCDVIEAQKTRGIGTRGTSFRAVFGGSGKPGKAPQHSSKKSSLADKSGKQHGKNGSKRSQKSSSLFTSLFTRQTSSVNRNDLWVETPAWDTTAATNSHQFVVADSSRRHPSSDNSHDITVCSLNSSSSLDSEYRTVSNSSYSAASGIDSNKDYALEPACKYCDGFTVSASVNKPEVDSSPRSTVIVGSDCRVLAGPVIEDDNKPAAISSEAAMETHEFDLSPLNEAISSLKFISGSSSELATASTAGSACKSPTAETLLPETALSAVSNWKLPSISLLQGQHGTSGKTDGGDAVRRDSAGAHYDADCRVPVQPKPTVSLTSAAQSRRRSEVMSLPETSHVFGSSLTPATAEVTVTPSADKGNCYFSTVSSLSAIPECQQQQPPPPPSLLMSEPALMKMELVQGNAGLTGDNDMSTVGRYPLITDSLRRNKSNRPLNLPLQSPVLQTIDSATVKRSTAFQTVLQTSPTSLLTNNCSAELAADKPAAAFSLVNHHQYDDPSVAAAASPSSMTTGQWLDSLHRRKKFRVDSTVSALVSPTDSVFATAAAGDGVFSGLTAPTTWYSDGQLHGPLSNGLLVKSPTDSYSPYEDPVICRGKIPGGRREFIGDTSHSSADWVAITIDDEELARRVASYKSSTGSRSFLSRFRRVLVDGIGSFFGLNASADSNKKTMQKSTSMEPATTGYSINAMAQSSCETSSITSDDEAAAAILKREVPYDRLSEVEKLSLLAEKMAAAKQRKAALRSYAVSSAGKGHIGPLPQSLSFYDSPADLLEVDVVDGSRGGTLRSKSCHTFQIPACVDAAKLGSPVSTKPMADYDDIVSGLEELSLSKAATSVTSPITDGGLEQHDHRCTTSQPSITAGSDVTGCRNSWASYMSSSSGYGSLRRKDVWSDYGPLPAVEQVNGGSGNGNSHPSCSTSVVAITQNKPTTSGTEFRRDSIPERCSKAGDLHERLAPANAIRSTELQIRSRIPSQSSFKSDVDVTVKAALRLSSTSTDQPNLQPSESCTDKQQHANATVEPHTASSSCEEVKFSTSSVNDSSTSNRVLLTGRYCDVSSDIARVNALHYPTSTTTSSSPMTAVCSSETRPFTSKEPSSHSDCTVSSEIQPTVGESNSMADDVDELSRLTLSLQEVSAELDRELRANDALPSPPETDGLQLRNREQTVNDDADLGVDIADAEDGDSASIATLTPDRKQTTSANRSHSMAVAISTNYGGESSSTVCSSMSDVSRGFFSTDCYVDFLANHRLPFGPSAAGSCSENYRPMKSKDGGPIDFHEIYGGSLPHPSSSSKRLQRPTLRALSTAVLADTSTTSSRPFASVCTLQNPSTTTRAAGATLTTTAIAS